MSEPPPNVDPDTGEVLDEDVPFDVDGDEAPEDEAGTELDVFNGDLVSIVGAGGLAQARARIEEYATGLTEFVRDHDLTLPMEDGGDYLLAPAYEALGQWLGYLAFVEWTKPIEGGWLARAVVRKMPEGTVYTAREAVCTRAEFGRERKPDHDIQSMAETRACRKALEMALSIIPNTAGFDTTPVEDRPITPLQRSKMFALFNRLDRLQPRPRGKWKDYATDLTMRRYGQRISGLNRAQADKVNEWLQGLADELAAIPKKDRPAFGEPTPEEQAEADRVEF